MTQVLIGSLTTSMFIGKMGGDGGMLFRNRSVSRAVGSLIRKLIVMS